MRSRTSHHRWRDAGTGEGHRTHCSPAPSGSLTCLLERLYDEQMTRRSGRNPDPARVVAAQLGGTAERCIIGHGLTDDQALLDFGACLGPLSPSQRQLALDYATARYVDDEADPAKAIVLLLARAGANLDRARAIHRERGNGFVVR
jgi:hypothetical protein